MENSTTTLHCLIYISSASKPMSSNELNSILVKSQENNVDLNITGMLVYSLGNIIQVLEGEKRVLDELYSTITADSRHFGVIRLMYKPIIKRSFGEWSMGFRTMTAENMDSLKTIFQSNLQDQNYEQNSIMTLIKNFVINNT